MTTIHAITKDQILSATVLPKVACNNQNTVRLHVDFDSPWDGYAKSAVFHTSKNPTVYEKVFSSDDICIVPPEVLTESCQLFIGVKGVSGSEVKMSAELKVKIEVGAPMVVMSDPTDDVYHQLLKAYAVESARLNNFAKLAEGSTTGDAELMDIRVGADGKTYASAGASVRAQFEKLNDAVSSIRGSGFMAEGELIIDTTQGTICAKQLMLLTSDRSFAYITNDSSPVAFDEAGASLRSIFAVKTDNGYELHLGVEGDMNSYENVYYICGYYSKQLVGGNFSPKLSVTINGVTKDAWAVTLCGEYSSVIALLDEQEEKAKESSEKQIDFAYNTASANENTVEFTANHITAHNVSIDGTGELGDSTNLARLSVREMLPAYNSDKVELIMSVETNYACNLYWFNENKEFVSSSYHSGKSGRIEAPISAPYFRVMVCRTSNDNIDTAELVKIRLYSVKRKTTLGMIPDLLLADGTTKIKLLGDSITQGMGSTGYVGYTVTENGMQISVRGNGPDYGSKGEGYVEGDYLGELGNRRWYESTSSTGWSNKIKEYFESKFDCIVKNYGMSGIGSENLSTLCKPLVEDDDDIVILMIGTNDRSNTSITAFQSNVKSFVEYLLEENKKVVLLGSTPVSVENEVGCAYHMEDINNILRSVAYSCDVPFISVYDHFTEYCENTNTEVDSMLNDGLHPNDSGYELMFKIISRGIGVSIKRKGATW